MKLSELNFGDLLEQLGNLYDSVENLVIARKTQLGGGADVDFGSVKGALTVYYDALITYIIKNLDKKLSEIAPPKVSFPVAVAGGSSIPKGFFDMFEKKLKETKLKIDIPTMIRAKDPLYSVARGCLIAARTQEAAGKRTATATATTTQKKSQSKTTGKKK